FSRQYVADSATYCLENEDAVR
ncbi:MAG: hypothetical protein QOG87_951, partial [Actinomycetota bacterium]